MRHQWPPAPPREVWFHRGWAGEERWTSTHQQNPQSNPSVQRNLTTVQSCHFGVSLGLGTFVRRVLWREIWLSTSRDRVGVLTDANNHFTIPKASNFVVEGSQGDGFWPNAEAWTSDGPLLVELEDTGMCVISWHPPTTDQVCGVGEGFANLGSKIESLKLWAWLRAFLTYSE